MRRIVKRVICSLARDREPELDDGHVGSLERAFELGHVAQELAILLGRAVAHDTIDQSTRPDEENNEDEQARCRSIDGGRLIIRGSTTGAGSCPNFCPNNSRCLGGREHTRRTRAARKA